MKGGNPYQTPTAEAVVEVRCRPAKAKFLGTRRLDTTDALIHPISGEIRFGIVPAWAFPGAIFVTALISLLLPIAGIVGYTGSYFLFVAFFSRPATLSLADEEVTVDTKSDVLAIEKRRKGRKYSISLTMTPEIYRLLPKLKTNFKNEELKVVSNVGWHVLALFVIVGSTALRAHF